MDEESSVQIETVDRVCLRNGDGGFEGDESAATLSMAPYGRGVDKPAATDAEGPAGLGRLLVMKSDHHGERGKEARGKGV